VDDILSQREIDDLLAEMIGTAKEREERGGKIHEKRREQQLRLRHVSEGERYDFRRPKKVPREQIRTIERIHTNFARLLTSSLGLQLRRNVDAELVSIEQVTYEEFMLSMPEPSVITAFTLPPLDGSAVLGLDIEMAFIIFDILCGGKGRPVKKYRMLTEIESSIIYNLMERILKEDMKRAWTEIADIEPNIELFGASAQQVQTISQNESIILTTIGLRLAGREGILNICLPQRSLEPILSRLTVEFLHRTPELESMGDENDLLVRRLKKIPLELKALLGTADITVKEFFELEVGDVITLERKATSPIDVTVEDKEKFTGTVGTLNNRLAIKLFNRIVNDGGVDALNG
jgi:flagellar motor switch protein FliM